MGTYHSKRLRAWDFAWTHIGYLAGVGDDALSEAQLRLREMLERLGKMPLPAHAIEDMALAIETAWRIGRESAGSEEVFQD